MERIKYIAQNIFEEWSWVFLNFKPTLEKSAVSCSGLELFIEASDKTSDRSSDSEKFVPDCFDFVAILLLTKRLTNNLTNNLVVYLLICLGELLTAAYLTDLLNT